MSLFCHNRKYIIIYGIYSSLALYKMLYPNKYVLINLQFKLEKYWFFQKLILYPYKWLTFLIPIWNKMHLIISCLFTNLKILSLQKKMYALFQSIFCASVTDSDINFYIAEKKNELELK